METQTAYCKRCKRNMPVTHYLPMKKLRPWLLCGAIVVLFEFGMNMAMNLEKVRTAEIIDRLGGYYPYELEDDSFMLIFMGVVVVISILSTHIPTNNTYCAKCGSYIGQKSEIRDRCVYCDAEIEPGVTFCPKCGKKLTQEKQTVTCKKCGTENTLEATYCVKCGAKLPASRRKKSQQTQRTEPVDKQEAYGWQYWE